MRNVLLVSGIVAVCVAWCAAAVFLRSDEPAKNDDSSEVNSVVVNEEPAAEGAFVENPFVSAAAGSAVADASQASPRATVNEHKFDFGLMDPVTEGGHTFVIKNEGQGPLKLRQGPTTCKCTLSKLSDGEVAPGQTAEVRLEWNTGTPQGMFEHSSTVWTNDPQNDAIKLDVVGVVRRTFGSDVLQIPFVNVSPGEQRSEYAVLYSQVWNEFEIVEVHKTLAGLEHSIEPATPEELDKLRASSGYRLKLTLPGDLPCGSFGDYIYVKARPIDGSQSTIELPLYFGGEVLPSISVVGEAVESDLDVSMGHLRRGQGGSITLSMLVRDLDRELQFQSTISSPDFLQLRVEPVKPSQSAPSHLRVYRIHLSVPRDVPEGNYTGPTGAGQFALKIDHPKVKEVKMNVNFIVDE